MTTDQLRLNRADWMRTHGGKPPRYLILGHGAFIKLLRACPVGHDAHVKNEFMGARIVIDHKNTEVVDWAR